ncbi:MAG: hypothetical protein H0X51_02560 [Parachlamydiaceae bacterium]|nr:hypothetical protein [Parachlamydiaceae bacterium]
MKTSNWILALLLGCGIQIGAYEEVYSDEIYSCPEEMCAYSNETCESVCEDACESCCGGHYIFAGPELYHLKREKEGGTHQSGGVLGIRLGYDRIKRCKFYWGGDFFYGAGTLNGKSAAGSKIRSKYQEGNVEGRIGYTLAQKTGYCFGVTPFVGVGYAIEKNDFVSPSPLHVNFRINYSYVPVGFYSKVNVAPCFDLGLNFKAKFMIEGKNRVTRDPDFGETSTLVKPKIHYRLELPLTYHYREEIFVSLVPFYEYRIFGGHAGFPFDFVETKLRLWGAAARVFYCF